MPEPQVGDAFGVLLADGLGDRGAIEIIERDDGFINAYPCHAYFAPFEKWPSHQRRAMKYVRGRVLDVGCGGGRVALYLQEAGREVVAIDASPGAVAIARKRGVKDVRLFALSELGDNGDVGTFDSFVMLGNNFGLFESETVAITSLRRLRDVASRDARLIVEARDPYRTDDPCHLEYHAQNRRRGRMGGQERLRVRHRHYATPWFDFLFVSRDEMSSLAQATGWQIGRFIPEDAPQYVAVLERSDMRPVPW